MFQVENQLHPMSAAQELDRAHVECQEMRTFTKAFLDRVAKNHLLALTKEGDILF